MGESAWKGVVVRHLMVGEVGGCGEMWSFGGGVGGLEAGGEGEGGRGEARRVDWVGAGRVGESAVAWDGWFGGGDLDFEMDLRWSIAFSCEIRSCMACAMSWASWAPWRSRSPVRGG